MNSNCLDHELCAVWGELNIGLHGGNDAIIFNGAGRTHNAQVQLGFRAKSGDFVQEIPYKKQEVVSKRIS